MKVPMEFRKLLEQQFEEIDWSCAKENLIPPAKWQNQIPFWDIAQIEGKKYYTRQVCKDGDLNNGGYTSTISFDENTGIIYFVGEQFSG